jgi:hypothetical protein
LIVAEGLKFKSTGSRIRSHPTDGIFQRGADQAGTDETRRQGVHRGVFRGRIAADFAPDLEAPITPNDQKTFQARNRLFNSPGRTETDLGLWPSQQPCLPRPSLAISEWQINQLKRKTGAEITVHSGTGQATS